MKKRNYLLALIIMLGIVVCSLLAACDSCNKKPDDKKDGVQIQLERTELTLDLLAREELTAVILDGDGNRVNGAVVWESSDTTVATVQDGLVSAIGEGTAEITAKYGGASAVCALTVEANGVRPQLLLGADVIELKTGATEKIHPSVRFKTTLLNDAEYGITYTYMVSEGDAVSVAADGTVTALAYGTATVTVKANWAEATAAGLDGSLTQAVTVNVLPSYTLRAGIADGYSTSVYLEEAEDGDEHYYNCTKLEVTEAIYGGNEITFGIVFKSSDEEVVTVDGDGTVTVADGAVEGDVAEVWAEYDTKVEGVITSDKITVTVKKAVVHKTLSEELLIEINERSQLPVAELFGDGEAEILSVYDVADEFKTNIYDKENSNFAAAELLGQRKWVVVGETICYEIDVLAVTKVLKTAEDFAFFDNTAASNSATFTGYYVLGNNIDVSGAKFADKTYPGGDNRGLTGTLDGRGYTVNGLELGNGGLFGVISTTAELKNIAFTNVSVKSTGIGLVLGWYVYGKVSNVYVGINEMYTTGTSSSASVGLFAICNDATKLKNIVVVNSADVSYTAEAEQRGQYGILEATTNKGAWENTFVVSVMRMFGGTSSGGDAPTKYAKSVERFDNMSALLGSSYYAEHKIAYDGDMWDLNTMSFASSAEYFSSEFSRLPDEVEVSVNGTVAITDSVNAFALELSEAAKEAGIVLVNGKIKATALASSQGLTVTVSFGELSKEIEIVIFNSVTVENYSYTYNVAGGEDFVISDPVFDGAQSATVTVKGTDGVDIVMNAQVSGTSLTVPASQFTGKLPSGTVEMTATVDGVLVGINGVKLIYAVTTVNEFRTMAEHLVASATGYNGSILLAADLDFENGSMETALSKATFNGEFDGGNHVLRNLSVTSTSSGGLFGILKGSVKNLVIKNATVSTYAGVICYDNSGGTISNCYIKGSIAGDGLSATSNPDNFGTGLVAGKHRSGSHVIDCIVEVETRKDVLYAAAAFGKLGDGTAAEANIFSNCYAVAAEGFALMTYGGNRTVKNFTEGGENGNLNFASIYNLFENPAARALAEALGVSLPTVTNVTVSQESATIYVENTLTLSATATAADGEVIGVAFEWTSSNEAIATVVDGEVTGVSAGTVTITVKYGEYSATCTVTVTKPSLENLVLEDFSYAYNGSKDFVVESETFPEGASEITAKIKGTDGNEIILTGITLSGGTLTIPAAQFNADNMPTKTVEMSLFFDGEEMIVEGVYLIYTVNTADEYMTSVVGHLTNDGSGYDGSILIGADLDFTGKSFANASDYPLFRAVFNGELDGGNHVLSNITMNGSASGAVCGTLNGTVKNLIIRNATVTIYGGVICDLHYGTIENCYVQGSIPSDGVSAGSDNFGAGLLAGRLRNGSSVVNCIGELSSKGATNVAGAFGKLGDGSAAEAKIFKNCYAVSADGFAIMTYGSARANKNFDEINGNKNFATIFDLFEDEAAGALAAKLGLEEPVITQITLSATELTVTVNGIKALTATAYTADNTAVAAPFVWASSDDAVATVENGVVKGIAGGTVTVTVSFGNVQATCTVTVTTVTYDPVTLTDFTYAYNGANDFVLENEAFPEEASEITATVIGMDGGEIKLTGITLSGNVLTIPAAQFNVANMPTKTVQMTLYFDGIPMTVNGVYLIYTINSLTELQNMKSRLTADFDGHLLLGADIDFTGVAMNTWAMKGVAFKGIFDGGLHTISNITYASNATACGLLGNIQAGAVARNIILTNLSINSYSGGIAYLNYGTVENCYVKGELVRDGLSSGSAPGNFGCGLLVGRSLNAAAKIENCIVEMTGHGEIYDGTNTSATIYGGAAFGMMGAGVTQAKYTNCYAVNADGITLCSNSKPSVFSNFTGETCGNFETLEDLLADETAAELAATLGLTASAN